MTQLVLGGFDGANPLGFFAALGLLRVLDQRREVLKEVPRLSWGDAGRWQALLDGVGSIDHVVEVVLAELGSWIDEPALELGCDGEEEREAEDDLKPVPERYRAFALAARRRAASGSTRTVEFAGAFATDVVTDNKGNAKPTALHFTAGQQHFLGMVQQLLPAVTEDHLKEALLGPWTGSSKLPSLSWDSTVARNYALRATDPSKEKRGSNPGAEALAFLALPWFPVAANPRLELQTACASGGWKSGTFRWPIWTAPATAATTRSLLNCAGTAELRPRQRAARGISVVFEASILRSDQGGYGSFTPSRVV